MFKRILKNKKGSAMVFTIVLLFNALIIVSSIIFISAMLSQTTATMSLTTKAFQKADSGMEYFLYEINKASPSPSDVDDLCDSFNSTTRKCTADWTISEENMNVVAFFLDSANNVLNSSAGIDEVEYIKVVAEVSDGSNKVSRSIKASIFSSP